tara:strand:- start:53075 stop:54151 length:1077 start_codon:yes stop_codon:yes gene_type:complete
VNLIKEIQKFDDSQKVDNAFTPPASWYVEKSFLDLEKRAVFQNEWNFVGHLSDVQKEGDYFTGKLLNKPFVVLRKGEDVKAYYNICSHHGTCVARGKGKAEKLTCPYHGWEYSLEGKLKKIPKAGAIKEVHSKDLNLKEIPLKLIGPFIFLFFGGKAQEVSPKLLNFFEQGQYSGLHFIKRIEYEISCNWKVYVDNYLDGGYHVPHMHPGLSTQLDISSYKTEINETFSVQRCAGEASEVKGDEVQGRVEGEAEYTWVYPNFMINRYGKWMDTNWVIPINENRCKVVFDYFHEEKVEDVDDALKASEKVQLEDIDICDMVQTGLNSGVYDCGVYAPQFEAPMYSFHKLLKKSFLKELS